MIINIMIIEDADIKELTRILVISKIGLEAYKALLKLAGDREILWVSSNPFLAYKALKDRKAKLFSFNTSRFNSISLNPTNLQEILLQVSRNTSPNCAVIISCLSELLAIHGLNKLYGFLLHLMASIEEKGGTIIGMLIEEAQSRSEEILISTLFDTTLKLKERNNELVLVPLTSLDKKDVRLRFLEPLTDEVDLGTTLP